LIHDAPSSYAKTLIKIDGSFHGSPNREPLATTSRVKLFATHVRTLKSLLKEQRLEPRPLKYSTLLWVQVLLSLKPNFLTGLNSDAVATSMDKFPLEEIEPDTVDTLHCHKVAQEHANSNDSSLLASKGHQSL
jgi:hypothetical protein